MGGMTAVPQQGGSSATAARAGEVYRLARCGSGGRSGNKTLHRAAAGVGVRLPSLPNRSGERSGRQTSGAMSPRDGDASLASGNKHRDALRPSDQTHHAMAVSGIGISARIEGQPAGGLGACAPAYHPVRAALGTNGIGLRPPRVRRMPVPAPLPGIAAHVTQAISVGLLLPNSVELAGCILLKPAHLEGIVRAGIGVVFPSPRRILSLRLRRQAVSTRRLLPDDSDRRSFFLGTRPVSEEASSARSPSTSPRDA